MSVLKIDVSQFERLQEAMQAYQGKTEEAINDVLHNEAGQLIHDAVKRLIPRSNRDWKGKKKPAATSNSLLVAGTNLSVTVKTKTAYNYLYFPNDGSNTRRHVGQQFFFERGGESQTDEVINRCIARLVNDFDNAVN